MGPNNDFCQYDEDNTQNLADIDNQYTQEGKLDIPENIYAYQTPQTKIGTGIQDSNIPDKVDFSDSERIFPQDISIV